MLKKFLVFLYCFSAFSFPKKIPLSEALETPAEKSINFVNSTFNEFKIGVPFLTSIEEILGEVFQTNGNYSYIIKIIDYLERGYLNEVFNESKLKSLCKLFILEVCFPENNKPLAIKAREKEALYDLFEFFIKEDKTKVTKSHLFFLVKNSNVFKEINKLIENLCKESFRDPFKKFVASIVQPDSIFSCLLYSLILNTNLKVEVNNNDTNNSELESLRLRVSKLEADIAKEKKMKEEAVNNEKSLIQELENLRFRVPKLEQNLAKEKKMREEANNSEQRLIEEIESLRFIFENQEKESKSETDVSEQESEKRLKKELQKALDLIKYLKNDIVILRNSLTLKEEFKKYFVLEDNLKSEKEKNKNFLLEIANLKHLLAKSKASTLAAPTTVETIELEGLKRLLIAERNARKKEKDQQDKEIKDLKRQVQRLRSFA